MKRIMLVLAVIVSVASSAFIGKAAEKGKINSYYWYTVNSSGQIVSGSQAYMGNKETVSYAQTNLPCTAGTDADCVRGFSSKLTSFPSTATGDVSPLQKQN